jgi:hypothetical protein
MIDILGHISYGSVLIGTLLVANKKAAGWLFKLFGGTLWAFVGIAYLKLSSVFLWEAFYALLCIYAYIKWVRNEKSE